MNKKKTGIAALAILMVASLGTAALLEYFGQITATVDVQQSVETDGVCSTALEAVGSETKFVDTCSIVNNTGNDLDVRLETVCVAALTDCDGITTTNRVLLSVQGFDSGQTDGFEPENYKKSYYQAGIAIDSLDELVYSFKVTENGFSNSGLAPYVVLISSAFDYDVAVSMIPDGGTYAVGEEYVKVVDDDTLFHIPGSSSCTQSTPCNLADIKAAYDGSVDKVSVAVGAWPDASAPVYSASVGITSINGVEAVHDHVTVYGNSTVLTTQKYDFDLLVQADVFDITTSVVPVP